MSALDFATAWTSFAIGGSVTVSDGMPEPSKPEGMAWRLWRSHNFTGTLVEKLGDAQRAMRFQLAAVGGVQVSYDVAEAVAHQFEVVA